MLHSKNRWASSEKLAKKTKRLTLEFVFLQNWAFNLQPLFPPLTWLTWLDVPSRQHLLMSGCAGRCAVCDLLAWSQQPSDLSLCHPLPDEEPQLRGPAWGAGGAPALTHALCSLWSGHRSPQWKTHCSRLVLPRIKMLFKNEQHGVMSGM